MSRFGFCGPTYRSQSVNADCQLTQNLYPESDESGAGNSAIVMYGTPGTRVFGICPDQTNVAVRGLFVSYSSARVFVVIGTAFYEQHADGSMTELIPLGTLIDDGLPVSFAENNAGQLIFCAGGQLWLYPMTSGATKGFKTDPFTISTLAFNNPSLTIVLTAPSDYTVVPVPQYVILEGTALYPQLNDVVLTITGINNTNPPGANQVVVNAPSLGLPAFPATSESGTIYRWGQTSFVAPFQVNVANGPFSFVDYLDGYFIATVANSQQFYLSQLEDGSVWNALDTSKVEEFPDNIRSMIVNQEIVWFFGTTKTIPYYDSGDSLFPLAPVPNILIEQGIAAPWSRVKADNSVFWIGLDALGNGIAWRANGYTPVRVSTHAIEYAWSQYGQAIVAGAMAYAYQDQGHTFWHIYFPAANGGLGASWDFDIATNQWHVRSHHSKGNPDGSGLPFAEVAHLSRCHCFAFGKHLVGDWRSSTVLEMSIDIYDDFNSPSGGGIVPLGPATTEIQRIRRAPHISIEQQFMRHNQLQVYLETGLATFTDGIPPVERGSLCSLRFSDDGGHSWSNYYAVECGQVGDFKKRVVWRRLGRARDRVYEISMSDPAPWRIVDAYLNATPGYAPQERLVKQYGKVT